MSPTATPKWSRSFIRGRKTIRLMLPALIAAFAGMFGAYLGAATQGEAQERLEISKKRNEAVLSLYDMKIVNDNATGEEFLDADQARKILPLAALLSKNAVTQMANMQVGASTCELDFDECIRPIITELMLYRAELGMDYVEYDSLTKLLREPLRAIKRVSRGRNDNRFLVLSRHETEIATEMDVSFSEADLDFSKHKKETEEFEKNFPRSKYLIIVEAAINEITVKKNEPNQILCHVKTSLSIQPARGVYPRITWFSRFHNAVLDLDAPVEMRRKCLIDLTESAVMKLVTTDPALLRRSLDHKIR